MYPTLLQTSDDDLRRRVVNFLGSRASAARKLPRNILQNIEVQIAGGVAVVSGSLPSARTKEDCLNCVRHVPGVVRLVDNVETPASARPLAFGAVQTPRASPTEQGIPAKAPVCTTP
ncbi:MAG: BON domain-containing protein [Planctomycetia bacterium]|nr:BON domain-containing protein [Planctomycetia bacterium]